MAKKKKIIELDDEIWEILEREAKADNRSSLIKKQGYIALLLGIN